MIETISRRLDLETERLFALLDGLAVHAAMRPEQARPERLLAVLSRHLDQVSVLRWSLWRITVLESPEPCRPLRRAESQRLQKLAFVLHEAAAASTRREPIAHALDLR